MTPYEQIDKLLLENQKLDDINKQQAARIDTLEDEAATYKTEAERLWSLLDDISTAGDMFKPEITKYFKYVNKVCDEAHKEIISDGHDLWWRLGTTTGRE